MHLDPNVHKMNIVTAGWLILAYGGFLKNA